MTSLTKTPAPLFASSSQAAKNALRKTVFLPAQRVRGVLQHWPALVSACGGDPKLAADFLGQDSNRGLLLGWLQVAGFSSLPTPHGLIQRFCHRLALAEEPQDGVMNDEEIALGIMAYDLVSFPEGFAPVTSGALSSGISSCGYDLTLAESVVVFRNPTDRPATGAVIDPANFDPDWLRTLPVHTEEDTGWRYVKIPPRTTALGHSNEILALPDNVFGVCLGKSTYARCGVDVMVTPLEPGWDGQVTLEFANNTLLWQRFYIDQGVLQVAFHCLSQPAVVPYHAKRANGGKYSSQRGIVLPRNSAATPQPPATPTDTTPDTTGA
jgi:dCTP deaminase